MAMERSIILALLVLLFAIGVSVAPAAGGSSSSLVGSLEVGVTYNLAYNTTVLLRELQSSTKGAAVKDVGYQILADAGCSVIWQHPGDEAQQLLLITVSSPRLLVRSRRAPQPDGFAAHTSTLDGISAAPLLLLTPGGNSAKQARVWRHPDASGDVVNLARGLAGLLQTRPEGTYRETDASGECDVTYTSERPRSLVKRKTGCEAAGPEYSASHPVLATGVTSGRVTWYTLAAGTGRLQSARSVETHAMSPAVSTAYGTQVSSFQELQVTGESQSGGRLTAASAEDALSLAAVQLGWTPLPDSVTGATTELECPVEGCQKLSELVSDLKRSLGESTVASMPAARAHVALVSRLRSSTQQQVAAVLKDGRNRDIMLSILDAAGAAQTLPVHTAVKRALNWQATDLIEKEERYLVALSTASHPPRQLVEDMITESKNRHMSPELHQSIRLTAAALAATLCTTTADNADVCESFGRYLTKQLDACDEEECCLPLLRELGSLRSVSTVTALMRQVREADEAGCRQEALRALTALPAAVTAPLRPQLERVYGETDRYQSTSRLLAADLLLTSPTEDDVTRLLQDLGNPDNVEVNAYALQRLTAAAEQSAVLKGALRRRLSDTRVNNYNVLAHGALSSVLERQVAATGEVSAGFRSSLEAGRAKELKRSTLTAQLESGGSALEMLTFSVAAGGLSGLLGSPDPDDASDAQARMELGLLGRQLRPRQLFSSQGELMGLLWSGAGSERTSALRGTVPLHDHQQRVPLQNGLTAQLTALSAVTFDFAGQVEVSLWNRNAHLLVDDRVAVLLRGVASVNVPWVRAQVDVSQAVEAQLKATTDIDFSDRPPKTCARISQEPVLLREAVRKQEQVPGSQYRLRRVRRRARRLGPVTFALNRRNADNCQLMFGGGR